VKVKTRTTNKKHELCAKTRKEGKKHYKTGEKYTRAHEK
jgi:hypothetical protein